MSHSGHITGRSIISSSLTAPSGDLISVKCWRSLSNGHVLLLSVYHWFLTTKGHGGITSYLRDQSPVLMTRSCHSSRAQTTRGSCCSPQLKAWFVYSSSINLEDGFSVQAAFIIYLVANIYYLFSAQNITGLCGNMTEAESIPWKAFRLIKTLKDEWGWMDKNGLEETKYSIASHYSSSQSYFIWLSISMQGTHATGWAPLFGCKKGNWREKGTSGCMDSKEDK